VGACLGVLGVTLIIGVDALNGLGRQVFAQLAVLFGAILYACAAIYGKNFSHLSPIATALGAMICAALCLAPLSLVIDHPWTLRPTTDAILATLTLALFGTAIAFLIYFRLVKTLGSLGVASQSYLRAGVGVALGVMVLGEEISMVVGVGLAAAILGVAAINTPRRPS
jgi:drug/metabolite transporter (DMT)-like permease